VLPALNVTLRGKYPGWLLWHNGYVLRRELPVRDDAGTVGILTTEQPLDVLTTMSSATRGLGDTGETAVCGGDAITLHCFPARNRPQPFSTARVVVGQPLPMDLALQGQSGDTTTLDYRLHRAALLLKQADAAMYRAKRAGRNGYVIYNADAE
jgi:hypothetical protein